MPGTKLLLDPVAKLKTTAPRNQILLTGTGVNLVNPNFALVSGQVCLNDDPAPRHPHSVTMGFVGNYPPNTSPSNFAVTLSIGPMATFGDCELSMTPTVGVTVGKLRVMITNYPNPATLVGESSSASAVAFVSDPANNFEVEVDIQDS